MSLRAASLLAIHVLFPCDGTKLAIKRPPQNFNKTGRKTLNKILNVLCQIKISGWVTNILRMKVLRVSNRGDR